MKKGKKFWPYGRTGIWKAGTRPKYLVETQKVYIFYAPVTVVIGL